MGTCNCKAAVMTAGGAAAISTILVHGPDVLQVLFKITQKALLLEKGAFCVNEIINEQDVIDQVVIGREDDVDYAIHCHGNPLIVEKIMELLGENGAELITAEQMLEVQLKPGTSFIHDEAVLYRQKACTLMGVRIINYQPEKGLYPVAKKWLDELDTISLDELCGQCSRILENSKAARFLIEGARIAIVGLPNSGKSTLFNALSGSEKAIVTDVPGTTRDWLSCPVSLGPMYAEVFDTAGLDQQLASADKLESTGQMMTRKIIDKCDIILYLADPSVKQTQLILPEIKDKIIINILNKCDLPENINRLDNLASGEDHICISAKKQTGFDDLLEAILMNACIDESIADKPAAFTSRQRELITLICGVSSKSQAKTLIERLLTGRESV